MNWKRSNHIGVFLLTFMVVCTCKALQEFQEIHKSMKKRDLSRIFGTEDPGKAPAYEIFTPFIRRYDHEPRDNFRTKRDLNKQSNNNKFLKLGIPAFGSLYHLNMTQNRDLITQNFRVEIKHKNGTFVKRDVRSDCYYHGNIHDEVTSLAAVSTCNGVSGMFTTDAHHYFIEPVPDYLHSGNAYEENYEKPHIVFRRSLRDHSEGDVWTGQTSDTLFQKLWNKESVGKQTTEAERSLRKRRADDSGITPELTSRSADNSERYIEALVVVDQKMVNYHGEDAATQFALVVMNMVARLLRDASIGANLIILVVLKLQLHTVDVPGLVINHHARNTLESFGNWAQRSSDQDDRSDDHYDYAILLTRYNICADDNQPCDNLGLTETGGMCQWPYSASVNEDNGLGLVYTVTHSIGHSLGMNHDGDESSFICPDNEFIMASTVSGDWKDNRNHWSRCSRNYLRQFLKKEQANCLRDLPVQSRAVDYDKMDSRPGILYEINKQCEMQFGTGSTLCNKINEGICQTLSCTNPSKVGKCFRSVYPAADGTNCAENKYCYRGKCIGSTKEMNAIDGGWSSWSDDYQACSRSCGGGVQYRTRQCIRPRPSNGGKYCEGEPRSYKLCNTQPCNTSALGSHRMSQCSNLNNRLFGERKFEWEFKPSKIGSCKLGCFISQTGHGYDFGNVEDGTNCDQMDEGVFTDKCINGLCIPVGCNKELGSKTKYDRCGVCNGDGLSCVTGSERSSISETIVSAGGISDALKSLREMGFDMTHLYGKSTLDLGGASGKRSEIMKKEEYGWARMKSGCSVSCGGGIETVTSECRRQDDGSPVREDKCDKRTKPPTQQFPCKEDTCPPIWQTSYWGDCSKTCNGGFKRRNVRCVQKSSSGIEYDLDGTLCPGVRPSDTEGCNKEPCPAEWIAQPFGECSTICGPGIQSRQVLCQKTIKDGSLVTLNDDECRKETKPPAEQRCNVHNPCPGDAGCGGIYTDKRGNFTSPGFPGNYPSNMECVHIIQVPPENVIALSFDKMNIVAADKECTDDFIKVMDGDCVSRIGESKFCGRTTPSPFISTTNRLCVKFYSDDSKTDEGFVAKYTAIEKPSQTADVCGSNLTAPDGLISSPNYPEFYPQNEDCNFTITTDEKPIKIKFHAFDVGSEDCNSDYIVLTGGEESKRFCGQSLPPEYVSKDNIVNLRFVSSNRQTVMKPGFVATYTTGTSESTRSSIPKIKNVGKEFSSNVYTSALKTKKSDIPNISNNTNTVNQASDNLTDHPKNTTNLKDHSDNSTLARDIPKNTTITPSGNATIINIDHPASDTALKEHPKNATNGTDSKNTTESILKTGGKKSTILNSTSQTPTVSFVKSKNQDTIAKEQVDEKQQNIHVQEEPELSPAQKAFINAMKDDTPSWIPEPANQKDAISDPNNNTKSASSPDDTKLSENETKSNDNKNASTKSHVGEMKKEASNKWKYLTIPDKKHKKKNNKKSYVSQPETSNLDSQYGVCPQSLRCIDLLMSYPCDQNGGCPAGLSCCPTTCGLAVAQKMCLPKVTALCPLQLPYQGYHIPCQRQSDCPSRGTCCVDIANQRYCRFPSGD